MVRAMIWNYFNPVKIHVGRGCRHDFIMKMKGLKLLLITTQRGYHQFINDKFLKNIINNNKVTFLCSIKENPNIEDLNDNIEKLGRAKFQAIIAFGGGSVIDASKVIRLGLVNNGDYNVEEIIEQSALHTKALQVPLYVLPTTSGTGSEVTPFATVWDIKNKKKLSVCSNYTFPTEAYIDSELTDNLPNHISISTGLDSINQAAESIWNKNANPLTLDYATRSLKLSLHILKRRNINSFTKYDRDCLSEASLLAGLAISHTRTALCHSISYPLTAHFNVPHGLACAFTMPAVCSLNLSVDDGRFAQLTKNLFNSSDAKLFLQSLEEINDNLSVVKLVKSKIKSLDDLYRLKFEMTTSDRASNNLANEFSIENILYNSWNY